ncbi:MAG: PEP/pyruvate-binding domain-containing protein, partial [Bacteroidales bacterium]
QPVAGAEVKLAGTDRVVHTDYSGKFSIFTGEDDIEFDRGFKYRVQGNIIYWQSLMAVGLELSNTLGQQFLISTNKTASSGKISLENLPAGIYLFAVRSDSQQRVAKLFHTKETTNLSKFSKLPRKSGVEHASADSIIISATGYLDQQFPYGGTDETYELLRTSYDNLDYLNSLPREEAFHMLQSVPFIPAFGEVESIKLVYHIPSKTLYYINSEKFLIHYTFAEEVLGYSKGHYYFNMEQYLGNPNRIYYLATLNHFKSSGIYTFEFFAGDEINCAGIEEMYLKIAETSYIGNKLRFYSGIPRWEACTAVPSISSNVLYAGQNFQALNPAENYGYLKKVDVDALPTTWLNRHDLVLTNGIPNDIPVTAGIITTEFQTPLSHINVLSHNRETPNMALRDGWTNPVLEQFIDKLVYLRVTLDSFYIRAAGLPEAQAFWARKEPSKVQKLQLDTLTQGLIDLQGEGVESVPTIGGKAANFAELKKVEYLDYPIQLPEGDFAIPVYYYREHMKKYGLDAYVQNMLKDEVFQVDAACRAQILEQLQDSIKKSPIDTALLNLVLEKTAELTEFTNIRFRSSTNAEDIEGFNGAGLYDSYTGIKGDPSKTMDLAIKKVWAGLWNYRAFEEREYFRIDHTTAGMAVLVHRSFPSEVANGVVVTKNLYNIYNSAITINVQVGETSIVNPTESYLPDGIIYYLSEGPFANTYQYISHTTVPGMEGKPVMTEEELELLEEYCMAIHYHYCALNLECRTMDIEFKIDNLNGQRILYIKQARLY